MNLHNAKFVKSVVSAEQIPHDGIPQLIFSGRSNAGKSSVINALLNRKQFARVSSTPGKTVNINYFLLDKTAYLVDLPGYGYAKAAKTEHSRWSKLMDSFFAEPTHITLAVMVVDSRHKPTSDDVTMAGWFKAAGCPVVVLANKIDKVKNSGRERSIAVIRKTLDLPEDTGIIMFSAVKGTGRDELLKEIFTRLKSN